MILGHRAAFERAQLLPPRGCGEKAGVEFEALRRAVDAVVELGGHFEQLWEIRIDLRKNIVEIRRTDEHYLDVERNGLRLERDRAGEAQEVFERNRADLLGAQDPLQGIPAETGGQQALGIEDQIAAIGLVQRARNDQIEIRDQGAETRQVLDAPDQVLMRRIVLEDDRRALRPGMLDDDIDLIAAQQRQLDAGRFRPLARRPFGTAGGDEILGMLEDVALDLAEIADHLDKIREGVARVVQEVADDYGGRVAVELTHGVAQLALPFGNVPHRRLELGLQRLDVGADPFAFRRRLALEDVRSDHFALMHRRQRQPHRRADERDALGLGLVLKRAERLLVAMLELLLDDLAPRAIVLPLEGCRQGHAQLACQPLHRVPERHGAAGGKAQRPRAMRIGEVVDVAPIVGGGLACRLALQKLADERCLPAPDGPKAKRLKPLRRMPMPKRMAASARSWPTSPGRSGISSVVRKPSVASSQQRRRIAAGSGSPTCHCGASLEPAALTTSAPRG